MNTIVSAYGTVRDERLRAVQHVLVAVAARRRLHRAERIRARVGLGDRPRADLVHREDVARPALLLRDGALRHDRGRREPDRNAHRGDHARRALAELDDRQHREAATAAPGPSSPRVARPRPLSSAAIRWSKLSAAMVSMPNVLYSFRSRSYGGMSPCSSSSRCGRISLSTNWRTASRTIWSSSGHSNMAGSYGTAERVPQPSGGSGRYLLVQSASEPVDGSARNDGLFRGRSGWSPPTRV